MEIDCRETLEKLYDLYNPSCLSLTWTETLFLRIMSELIREKLLSEYLNAMKAWEILVFIPLLKIISDLIIWVVQKFL